MTDIQPIAAFGVLSTPALLVDGTVQVTGRVPTVGSLKELLSAAAEVQGRNLEARPR